MALNAPTKIVFIISVILAIVSILPAVGVTLGGFGAYNFWLLLAAFIILVAGNILPGL